MFFVTFLLVFEFQVLQIELFLLGLIVRPQVVILVGRGVVVYSDALPGLDVVDGVSG